MTDHECMTFLLSPHSPQWWLRTVSHFMHNVQSHLLVMFAGILFTFKKKSINPLADVIFSSSWHLFNTWKSEFKKKKEQCGLCRSWLFLTFIWQILTQRWCLIRLDFASLSKQDAFDETLFGISSANPFLETHLCGNKEHWTMLTGVTEEMTFQNGCININPQLKATVMGNSHAKREWWNYGSSFLYCEGKLITASNI